MASDLEDLLDRIDPRKQMAMLNERADQAMNTFPWKSMIVEDVPAFERGMFEFYHHVWFGILGLSTNLTRYEELEYGLCRQILDAEYGHWSIAYEYAHTGMHGGLYAVCKAVAKQLVAQHFSNYVGSQVSDFWYRLAPHNLSRACDEYIARYGHLWPPELSTGGGFRMKMSFHRVLAEHPFLIQRLSELGR
jgi:hypothetical protein